MAVAYSGISAAAFNAGGDPYNLAVDLSGGGSDRALVVFVSLPIGSITTVKWNTTESLTLLEDVSNGGGSHVAAYGLLNPSAVSSNVTVDFPSGQFTGVSAAFYTGVSAFGNTGTANPGNSNAITATVDISTANSWSVMGVMGGSGTAFSASTDTTERVQSDGWTAIFDSNGGLATGNRSLIATVDGGSFQINTAAIVELIEAGGGGGGGRTTKNTRSRPLGIAAGVGRGVNLPLTAPMAYSKTSRIYVPARFAA